MANVTPIKKDGVITSYRIRVYNYTDSEGKKHFYSENWTVPSTYKSEKAIDSALLKEVGRFEAACKRGDVSTENSTVSEFCRYYIEVKDLKPATVQFYTSMLPFIDPEIGYLKLKNVTPLALDNFYRKLQTSDVRLDRKATANERCQNLLKSKTMKRKDQADAIGIAENTIREALKGNKIAVSSAEKIAKFYRCPVKDLFDVGSSNVGLSTKTVRHISSFLYSVFEYAEKKGLIPFNPSERTEPPKVPAHEAEHFELSEILTIKKALDKEPLKYRIATYLLIDTGCRRGELLGLRWDSFDLKNATVRIERNVQYLSESGLTVGTPKNGKTRTVSIARELIPILLEYKREQENEAKIRFSNVENALDRRRAIKAYNPEGYLFIQENGEIMHPSALNSWMRKFSEKVGLHVYPHKFRHSQASLLIASGVDVVTVSKRLGHSQVSTTENIYAHLLEDSDRGASDVISDVIFKNA